MCKMYLLAGIFTIFFSLSVAEATAQSCLEGRTFKVDVTNCNHNQFTDVVCFGTNEMTVKGMDCKSGRARITCKNSNATFSARVGGGSIRGTVKGNRIKGTAMFRSCRYTFVGKEILECPCITSQDAEEPSNLYLP